MGLVCKEGSGRLIRNPSNVTLVLMKNCVGNWATKAVAAPIIGTMARCCEKPF